jgi:hypothetical protein
VERLDEHDTAEARRISWDAGVHLGLVRPPFVVLTGCDPLALDVIDAFGAIVILASRDERLSETALGETK